MGLLRGKIRWTIPGAGTAYSVLHFGTEDDSTPTQADADEAVSKMNTFAGVVKDRLPNVVSLQVMNEVEEIVATTGDMLGVYTAPATTVIAGTGAPGAGWAAAAGAVITWNTAGVRNGRRVRGRTFLVPLTSAVWDADGTLSAVVLTALNAGATALRTEGSQVGLVVYSRPSGPGATDGAQYQVTGHRIPDMSAILRSRRS